MPSGFSSAPVARGCTRNTALLGLARTQALCGRTEDAIETLAMIPDDPHDPSVAAERDHIARRSKTFTEPELAFRASGIGGELECPG